MAKSTKNTVWNMVDNHWVASFRMTVQGGDLPKDRSWELGVKISFKDAQFVDYRDYITGGMSGRVTLQGMLRKQPVSVLDRLAKTGLEIHVKALGDADALLTPNDRAAIVVRFIESLPPEVQAQAIEDLKAKGTI